VLEHLHRLPIDVTQQVAGEDVARRTVSRDTTGAQNRHPARVRAREPQIVQHHDHGVPGARPFPARTQHQLLVSEVELDPVDLSVALSEDAQLPVDDGESGSGGSGDSDSSGTSGTTGGTGTTGSTTGGVSGALASTGSSVPAGAVGTAGEVAVAAGAGVVYAMRRRRTEGA